LNKQPLLSFGRSFLLLSAGAVFLLSTLGCDEDKPVVDTGDVSYPSGIDATFYIPFVEDIGYLAPDVVTDINADAIGDIQSEDTGIPPVDTQSEDSSVGEDALEEDTVTEPEDTSTEPDVGEPATCEDGSLCDDGNPCTEDLCTPPGNCEYLPVENTCDDGNDCTENDDCAEGECVGDWLDCDDDNPCTNEACVPGSGCVYQNTDGYCGENSQWICVEGECVNTDE